MLSIDLTGNLSDHMVRYAICRTVAEKNKYDWGINPRTSHDYYGGKEQMFFFEDINYGISIDTPFDKLPKDVLNVWEEKTERYPTHAFHPFQPDIFDIPDWTKLIIYCGQDPRYFEKEKLKKWFAIKATYRNQCEEILKNNDIELDENLTVINARGGEYKGLSALFLRKEYWADAMNYMWDINPKMRFIVVTEDPNFFRYYFDLPVYHFGICPDYYIVNHAKNLIISNSGFGLFPTYLNENVENVIAPRFWSSHNTSDGYWGNAEIWRWGEGKWKWLDRNGEVYEQ